MINSISDLDAFINHITYDPNEEIILFRGEFGQHPTILSGRKRSDYIDINFVHKTWKWTAKTLLVPRSIPEDLAPSILQHYGYATDFVDLTTDIHVALFFTNNRFKTQNVATADPMRVFQEVSYTNHKEGIGRLYVFKIPKDLLKRKVLFDLCHLGDDFKRPSVQSGFLFHHPEQDHNNLKQYIVEQIDIDRKLLQSKYSSNDLFPSEKEDIAYSILQRVPFVSAYDKNGTHIGLNFLNLPIYPSTTKYLIKDHLTIYTPPQYFFYRQLNCSKMLTGGYWDGKVEIKNSIKLITPEGFWNHIDTFIGDVKVTDLHDMKGNSYFIEISQFYHGKHQTHEYPLHAFWFLRENEKFKVYKFELNDPNDVPGIYNGHTYTVNPEGDLVAMNEMMDCTCGHPEQHEREIKKILYLTLIFEADPDLGIPHPSIPEMYLCGI